MVVSDSSQAAGLAYIPFLLLLACEYSQDNEEEKFLASYHRSRVGGAETSNHSS